MNAATIPIGPWQLAIALSLVMIPALCSMLLRLGLGRQILVASLRSIVQLLAIGYVLAWVFAIREPWAIAATCAVMMIAAGHIALSRTRARYKGAYLDTFLSIAVASLSMLAIATALVIQPSPWWSPRYLIPILGMLLGNTLNGLSLGLSVWLEAVKERRERIESLLALGATAWEASRESISDALRRGLTPILNAMASAGIVSLPGMMTGQILAGNSPEQAVRYQIMILFLIAGTTAIGTLMILFLSFWRLFDERHRLRTDRLR